MFKTTALILSACLVLTATAFAEVTPKVVKKGNLDLTYPVFSFENKAAEKKATKYVQDYIDKEVKAYQRHNPINISADYKVIKEREWYISLEVTTYEYTGGAHGMYYTAGLNFDKMTGELMQYSDFNAPKLTKEELYNGIKNGTYMVFCNDRKTPSSAPFLPSLDKFRFTKNFIVDPEGGGVYLMYQPYELDCYAAGVTYVGLIYYG